MTWAALITLINERIAVKAMGEPDPVDFFSRAMARVMHLQMRAAVSGGSFEDELIKFGQEFGLLAHEMEKVN